MQVCRERGGVLALSSGKCTGVSRIVLPELNEQLGVVEGTGVLPCRLPPHNLPHTPHDS